MPKLLVVDLLAEREAFGKKGVEEIVRHFPEHEVLLWAPHTDEVRDYGFGIRIDEPVESDVVVITGSRRNVSMWEPWMDDVAKLIRECEVPLYGICFGHQIICKALGGEVIRADEGSSFIAEVTYNDGVKTKQLFTHDTPTAHALVWLFTTLCRHGHPECDWWSISRCNLGSDSQWRRSWVVRLVCVCACLRAWCMCVCVS